MWNITWREQCLQSIAQKANQLKNLIWSKQVSSIRSEASLINWVSISILNPKRLLLYTVKKKKKKKDHLCMHTHTIFLHQSEGRWVPAILNVGWLHIQVSVNAHGLLAWVWAKSPQNYWRKRDLFSTWQLEKGNPWV